MVMEEEKKSNHGTLQIYLRLVDTINEHQSRLVWSELVFIAFEVAIFFGCVVQVIRMGDRPIQSVGTISSATVLVSLVIGIAVSAYWIAYSMRLQLRLKLRYFQARYLERKLGGIGEDIFAGDARFNKDMTTLESPDGVETIVYPRKGALRMDGLFGGAKPRVLSVLMPGLFFILFMTLFIWILVGYLPVAS
jgi:hypothetical protein